VILVQLHGGLGNQMFQAAAGLALADRVSAPLAFDLSRYRSQGLRAYALEPFGLLASIRETPVLAGFRQALNRLRGEKRRPAGWSGPIFVEPHFHYAPAFEGLTAPVMLAGYFQSPHYWSGREALIANAFRAEKLASETGLSLAKALPDNAIALHLRRGDYAADSSAAAMHGVLDWDYYDRAVARVRQDDADATCLVFSDSAAAAEEGAARWPNARALRGASAGDDLFLMSRCCHHIIANSSFSWWSAWLDRREGGMRIAPERWFASGADKATHDLCPPDWLRL
jgi:Glycosyl transferase family 11